MPIADNAEELPVDFERNVPDGQNERERKERGTASAEIETSMEGLPRETTKTGTAASKSSKRVSGMNLGAFFIVGVLCVAALYRIAAWLDRRDEEKAAIENRLRYALEDSMVEL
jgi:ferric-dicitrate binding protein FerR (iron transport regulator)